MGSKGEEIKKRGRNAEITWVGRCGKGGGTGDRKALWEGRIALRGQERCERSLNVRNQMFLMGVSAQP